MNDLEYTYAVARIRALESSLFSGTEIERLLACSDEEQCLQLLSEKGWGDATGSMDASAMLKTGRREDLGSDSRCCSRSVSV